MVTMQEAWDSWFAGISDEELSHLDDDVLCLSFLKMEQENSHGFTHWTQFPRRFMEVIESRPSAIAKLVELKLTGDYK
jgi:hypothetical protein